MAIQKTSLPINFAMGLDQKTDPFQVAPGKMLALQNSVFTKAGRLTKRNGFAPLASLPNASFTHLTTYSGNLTAIGSRLSALSASTSQWIDKGSIRPASLSVLPTVRSAVNHPQGDSVVAPNGTACTAYTETNSGTNVYKYVIADSVTGQNLIPPTLITPTAGTVTGSPRVFVLGSHFMIVFTATITASNRLQYIAVSTANPTAANAPVNVTSNYVASSGVAFDGVVANNNLYLAWNGADTAVHMTYIDFTLLQHNTTNYAGRTATIMGVNADVSGTSPIVWATFYNSADSTGYAMAVDGMLNTVRAPIQVINGLSVRNITGVATGGVETVLYEVINAYSYDAAIPTDYIQSRTVPQSGAIGAITTVVRSVGLASKAFLVNGVAYFLGAYQSDFQPTYFLLDTAGKVIAKIAYSNGGGYVTFGLPGFTVTGNVAQFAYLYRDLIQSVNKAQGAPAPAGVYSQTGVNLATIDLAPTDLSTAEIGNDLNLSGGVMWMYDGVGPVEQGFNVWPDNVEVTAAAAGGFVSAQQYFYQAVYEWTDAQGNIFRSAPSIPVSVTTTNATGKTFASTDVNTTTDAITVTGHGYITGQSFALTTTGGLPAPLAVATTYYAIIVDANTIKVASSLANAIAGTAIDLTTQGTGNDTIVPITGVGSNTVNVPTLRLTYKTATPVKIVIYRWSQAQQEYFQVTSITAPLLNDTTVDQVSFIDTLSDAQIVGNSLIYTTGGVIENIAPPATDIMALYKSRLIMVDSEDRNLLWYSKQVIEGTPVEMSDLFTVYVAPTTAAQGSTGPITALSALDDKLIVFKRDAIYYITGNGPDNTGINNDFSEPVFISATVGCTNQQSIVFTPQGLMFQSDKGIWMLGRDLSTQYVGAPVEDYNADPVLSALNVPGTNQVRFTMTSGATLMYDYYFGQWGTFVNIPGISSTLYKDLHTYIDKYGRAYQEAAGVYLDGSKPVTMKFTTSWLNIAGLQGFERAYFFYLLGVYLTPHKLSVEIAYDYASSPTQISMISPTNFTPNWGGEQLWGSGGGWGGDGNIEQHRVFLQQQKCQAFQITITEIYDPSFGVPAGAGLTISGINCMIGVKDSKPRLRASKSVG